MKKLLTLSNVLKATAAIFGLVAFCLMFADQLYFNVFTEKAFIGFEDALFGENGAALSFVGYLLVLLATLATCVLTFAPLKDKMKKIVNLAVAGVMIIGAIFIFVEAAVVNGKTDTTIMNLAAAPIIAGIFSIISALGIAVSEFVPNKSLIR
ncbi:MAG: hypothetical protein IKR09_02000 [Alphaproteobacteria bacterium]|nr:hypothetical protein [Alphaproteobacteria bacterium]MBR4335553.1 hypothetical protein [Clostridia bacterium]